MFTAMERRTREFWHGQMFHFTDTIMFRTKVLESKVSLNHTIFILKFNVRAPFLVISVYGGVTE